MTLRKEIEPLRKITINVFASDYERVAELFPTVGPQRAIRQIVRNFVLKIDAKAKGVTDGIDIRIDGEGPPLSNQE